MSPASHEQPSRGGGRMRLRGLMRKEFLQILRDPSSIAIAFLLPVLLLLIFGYGVSLDAEHVPIALVVEQPSADTASFTGGFQQSRYFAPVFVRDLREAEAALMARRVDAIVHLRSDFARQLPQPGGAPVQVIVNGVDANTGRLILGYAQGAWQKWLEQQARARGETLNMPVQVGQRVWFNSELRSRNFLVPGLIAIIMTLIGALLTALVMSREWERGTMEALMVTPVTMREVLLGKLLPYFVLGTGGMALSVALGVWLFGVPLRGSLVLLFAASSLFLLAALGMGLLISTVTKNQFVAGQVAIIITFLPAFILSGFIFDIGSMPRAVQAITHIIAARYFVTILQTLFLAGNVWSVLVPNALALALMAAFFLGMSRRKLRKRLE
jgi:ABC-2 type transport system permease protein